MISSCEKVSATVSNRYDCEGQQRRRHRLKIVFPLFIVITRCSSSCIVITGNSHRPAMTGHAKKRRHRSSLAADPQWRQRRKCPVIVQPGSG
jgi:hypothetical protein